MKTVEQAAIEHKEKLISVCIDTRVIANESFKAGVEFAQQWISVDE